jgi:hypothetical protein
MYLGAAALLWLVRAWKIGELEEKAMMDAARLELGTDGVLEGQNGNSTMATKVGRSAFTKRLFMWQRV